MCPACIAGAAWIIGSAVTTSGAGFLGMRGLRRRKDSKTQGANYESEERRNEHGKRNEQDGTAQSGNAG
jgi:hypothetical protein